MMQQQEDPPGKGAYYRNVGVHPSCFQAIPPVTLGQPGPGQLNQEHGFPGAPEMHGYIQAPQMQGVGPEVAMHAYGQPVDGMQFCGTAGPEMSHAQMQGMQHMGFNGMAADPNGMGHMMMHFPNQRMHGQWPGYNGMAMPGEMPPPDGAMYQPAPAMVHQHPGYPPVVASMNAQGSYPPPMNSSMGLGFHAGMVGSGAVDNADHSKASGAEMVEQLMANVSAGSGMHHMHPGDGSDKHSAPSEPHSALKSNAAFMQMPVAASPTAHHPNFFGRPYLPPYGSLSGAPVDGSQHPHAPISHQGTLHPSIDVHHQMGYSMGPMHSAHGPDTSAPPQHQHHPGPPPSQDPQQHQDNQRTQEQPADSSALPTLPQYSAQAPPSSEPAGTPPSQPPSASAPPDAASSAPPPSSHGFPHSGYPPHSHMMYPMHASGPHPAQYAPHMGMGMPMPPSMHGMPSNAPQLGPPFHSAAPGVPHQVAGGVPVHIGPATSQPSSTYAPHNLVGGVSNAPGPAGTSSSMGPAQRRSTDHMPGNQTPRNPGATVGGARPNMPNAPGPGPGGPLQRGPHMHGTHPPPGMLPNANPPAGTMHGWAPPPHMGANMQMAPMVASMQYHAHAPHAHVHGAPQAAPMSSNPMQPQGSQSHVPQHNMHGTPQPASQPPPHTAPPEGLQVRQPVPTAENPASEPLEPSSSTPHSNAPPSGPPPGLSMQRNMRPAASAAAQDPPMHHEQHQLTTQEGAPLTPPGLQIPLRSPPTPPQPHPSLHSGVGGTRGAATHAAAAAPNPNPNPQTPSDPDPPRAAPPNHPQLSDPSQTGVATDAHALPSMGTMPAQSARSSLHEPSTARSAASSMHTDTPKSRHASAALAPSLGGAVVSQSVAAPLKPPDAPPDYSCSATNGEVAASLPAGTVVNISDLFSGLATPSAGFSGAPNATNNATNNAPEAPHQPPQHRQRQRQRQPWGPSGESKGSGEWVRKPRDEDLEAPDEARPPPGPPTLLPINPPPPGILQLTGERTNSTVAVPEGKMPVADMHDIDASVAALVQTLKASNQEHQELCRTFSRVKDLLQQIRPDGQVYLYGSVESKLCLTQNNDLDITLVLGASGHPPQEPTDPSDVVEQLGEALEQQGMHNIKILKSARVPVVKFVVPGSGTQVDATINNQLPLRNTALISAYCAIDTRLRDMIFVIKHWAKTRQIADAYQSTLSSYAWVLMCIFVAQRAGLVPVLHREEPKDVDEQVEVAGKLWNCQFNTDVAKHAAQARGHWISTGGLLTMFFDYFATRFDFNSEVVCPARGHTIPKQELDWTRKIGTEKHLCSIQDPLLLSHDLGRTVHYDSRKIIQQELGRASRIMYTTSDPIRILCEPYRSSVYSSRGGGPAHKDREYAGRGPRDGEGRGGGGGAGPPGARDPRSHPGGPRGGYDDRNVRRGGPRDTRRRQLQHGGPRGPPAKPPPPGFEPHEPLLDGNAVV